MSRRSYTSAGAVVLVVVAAFAVVVGFHRPPSAVARISPLSVASPSYGSILSDPSIHPPADLILEGGPVAPGPGDLTPSEVVAKLMRAAGDTNGTVADVDLVQTRVDGFTWHGAMYDRVSYIVVIKGRTEYVRGVFELNCSSNASPHRTCAAQHPIKVNRIYVIDPSTAFVYASMPSGG